MGRECAEEVIFTVQGQQDDWRLAVRLLGYCGGTRHTTSLYLGMSKKAEEQKEERHA